MAEHLTDEQQFESLKQWWKENGMQLVLLVVLAVGGWYAWQQSVSYTHLTLPTICSV